MCGRHLVIAASAFVFLASSRSTGQTPPPATTTEPAPAAPSGSAAPDAGIQFRFPLLREGSSLVQAPVTLRRDADAGTWVITVRDDIDTEADREITALPCETLEEMIAHIRGRTQVQWFELTALVLTYHNRNYLLPLMATPLSAEPPRAERSTPLPPGARPLVEATTVARAPTASETAAASGAPPASDASAGPPPEIDPETFAAEVERALEARIRVVPRSGDAGPTPSPFVPARIEPRLSPAADRVLLPTEVRVQDRRGVVTRDPITGTWRFVMQGERADMGERGIELLPSTTLERLERFVRQSEGPPALLVSGRLTRFEGRNFLLPSSFRTISSGRWIHP